MSEMISDTRFALYPLLCLPLPPNIMQTGLMNMHDYFGMNKFIAFEFFPQIIQHLQLFEIQSIHSMCMQLNKNKKKKLSGKKKKGNK